MGSEAGVSVLILTRGRPDLLRACLRSAAAAGPVLEIIAGVDGEDPASLAVIAGFATGVKAARLPRMCRGEARNALAALARGRWLCFIDDDTLLPPGYFDRLRRLIEANPGFSVFGGGQLTHEQAGRFERAVCALLASPWGAGPFTERFSPVSGDKQAWYEKFILCNLTVDSGFLRREGLAFEGHLSSAEENLLLGKMAAAGAKMLLSGDLNLVHRRRSRPGLFARQVFSCGRGRGQITVLHPGAGALFTLLPPAALLLLAAAGPGNAALPAAVYAGACAAAAMLSGGGRGQKMTVLLLFPVLHASYAAGWLWGAGEAALERFFRRRSPARCYCEGKI